MVHPTLTHVSFCFFWIVTDLYSLAPNFLSCRHIRKKEQKKLKNLWSASFGSIIVILCYALCHFIRVPLVCFETFSSTSCASDLLSRAFAYRMRCNRFHGMFINIIRIFHRIGYWFISFNTHCDFGSIYEPHIYTRDWISAIWVDFLQLYPAFRTSLRQTQDVIPYHICATFGTKGQEVHWRYLMSSGQDPPSRMSQRCAHEEH